MIDATRYILLTCAFCVTAYAALTYGVPLLMKFIQRRSLVQRTQGRLVLTYDDGPGVAMTPGLIDVLRRHGARATFFLVGFRAQRSPLMCDLLREAGHEIGSHTHWHADAWKQWPWTAAEAVRTGERMLERWLTAPRLFRPPFGRLTLWSWLAARFSNAAVCWWTLDGGDTHPTLPDPQHIVRQIEMAGGGVVLLHSHDRGDERRSYVLEVTEQLLIAARARGWSVSTMSQALVLKDQAHMLEGSAHVHQA